MASGILDEDNGSGSERSESEAELYLLRTFEGTLADSEAAARLSSLRGRSHGEATAAKRSAGFLRRTRNSRGPCQGSPGKGFMRLRERRGCCGTFLVARRSHGESLCSATGISEESYDYCGVAGVAILRADSHSDVACDYPFRPDISSARILLLSCGG